MPSPLYAKHDALVAAVAFVVTCTAMCGRITQKSPPSQLGLKIVDLVEEVLDAPPRYNDVDPKTELAFLHDLPVELSGASAVTKVCLADLGVTSAHSALAIAASSRSCIGREACIPRLESRSACNRDAPSGPIGRSAIGARQEARNRADFPADAAPSRGQGCHPPPCQISTGPHRDGARAFCRHAFGNPLNDATRADIGNQNACRSR